MFELDIKWHEKKQIYIRTSTDTHRFNLQCTLFLHPLKAHIQCDNNSTRVRNRIETSVQSGFIAPF